MDTYGIAHLLFIFPIIGVLFNTFVGRAFVDADQETGELWSGWFATAMALASFGVAVGLFLSLGSHGGKALEPLYLFDWIRVGDFYIPWKMQLDTLTSTMTLVITGVGSLIHIYAMGYMHGDKDYPRFFALLNLFFFFMLILVTGNNYLMLFVGWEGVGLCSFLLIGFWFDKPEGQGILNGDAARKAFVANRVGDFAMILAMILTFWAFGSMEYDIVFANALELYRSDAMIDITGQYSVSIASVINAITILFLIGATGKSAQIPLFVWLPDAMAGPTPVSALIHAATMVTSGIYLIVRSNVLFEIARENPLWGSTTVPDIVAIVGATTAVYAGLIAFTQFDVKKVLAYSTVSQLGFMIAAVGMGAYVAGMFHLITHAFFKALLFMGSGSIIHGMEHGHHHLHDHGHGHDDHHEDDGFDPQDMRFMGGLRHKMPVTFWVYMTGTLALAGIFPFAGFWSKDEILAHAQYGLDNPPFAYTYVQIMLTIGAFCTAFYMGRQIKMVFFGSPRHEAVEHVPESSRLMTRPLAFLAVLSIFGGFLNFPNISFGGSSASDSYEGSASTGVLARFTQAEEKGGFNLALEHWLEHSVDAFAMYNGEEGVYADYSEFWAIGKLDHVPHTPTSLQWNVAILSTIVAVSAILLAFFLVFRDYPKHSEEPDPISTWPVIGTIWVFFKMLPLDTLYMDGIVKNGFRPLAALSNTIDWDFWHDFFHNNIIRDSFVAASDFLSEVIDPNGVDGMVNGVGTTVRNIGAFLRRPQTGNVGNYALSLFLGVALLVAYFVFLS